MMIRTAGGPGLVSPIDFNERKGRGLSRSAWIAIGVVAMAHAAVGVGLYYQRFELEAATTSTGPGPIDVIMRPPPPKPLEPIEPTKPRPAAPNTKLNDPPPSPFPTETITATSSDTPATSGPITIVRPVEKPTPEAPPATAPEPPASRVITNPDWASMPSAEQLMQAYPDRAIDAGVAGSVTLNCLVETNGRVSDCNVTRETPGNYRFGRAAQSLSRYFRMSPRTVNGAAEGSRVDIGLRFVPPAD